MKSTKPLKFLQTFVKRKNGSRSIYDALNLFSTPKKQQFKPSILTSVAHGPVTEQFKDVKHETKLPPPELDIGRLANIIDIAAAPKETLEFNDRVLECSDAEFRDIVKRITGEKKLIRIAQILYFNSKLSFNKLTALILNKNLVNLKQLPFDVSSIRTCDLAWEEMDYFKFDISMLHKYSCLHEPLKIVKHLSNKFETDYLPVIESKQLPQFYERALWRYFFQYMKNTTKNEGYYIGQFEDLYHSFTIWESTLLNSRSIASQILATHDGSLNKLQTVFLETCKQSSVNEAIDTELNNHHLKFSETLSNLKKISIKHQIHSFGDLKTTTVEQRAALYVSIDSLERFMANYTGTDGLLTQLKQLKNDITNVRTDDGLSWDDKFLFSTFMK